MTDTDEFPAMSGSPRPPAELWGVWDTISGRWLRRFADGGEVTLLAFPDRESARRFASPRPGLSAHPLIPPGGGE